MEFTNYEFGVRLFLLLNGSLVLVDSDGKKNIWEPDRFCLDGAASFSAAYSDESLDYPDYFELGHYSGHEGDQTAILCYMDEPRSQEPEVSNLISEFDLKYKF